MTAPSTGRIVHYELTELNADTINATRETLKPHQRGNTARAGQVLPLLVVRAFDEGKVNGQVFLDGNDTLWVTSVSEGNGRGQWSWPRRV